MKNIRLIVSLLASAAWLGSAPAGAADMATDAAQVATQGAAIPGIQEAVAAAAGYQSSDIEIHSTAHQITLTVVNSKLYDAPPAGRSSEALKMIQALEKSIAGQPEFAQVMMVHVDYLSRHGAESKTVQGFDFNKAPSGSFVLHTT